MDGLTVVFDRLVKTAGGKESVGAPEELLRGRGGARRTRIGRRDTHCKSCKKAETKREQKTFHDGPIDENTRNL